MAAPKVNSEGKMGFVFNSKMLGMEFLRDLDVKLQSKGQVSDLYADEDGDVGDQISSNGLRRLNSASDGKTIFDLSKFIDF